MALTPFALVQCLKEIAVYADHEGGSSLKADDFAKCVLGINEEVDENAFHEVKSWEELHDSFTLFAIAETSALHSSTLATLCADAEEIWYRDWPSSTDPGILSDIGSGPAAMFEEATGINISDFFALGFLIYRTCEMSGQARLSATFFHDHKVPAPVERFFTDHCTLTPDELRQTLAKEMREGTPINPWSRYTLQQRPFVRLADGSFIMMRLQYALQRFFGDHPYLESRWILSQTPDKKRQSKHFSSAMQHLFEQRVGEVLERISNLQSPRTGGVILSDPDFRAAWGGKNEDEIGDWGYAHGNEILIIDANMRSLLQGLAEGTAEISVLDEDLQKKYRKKFSQLVSTVKQFRSKGWPDSRVSVTDDTKYIPIVLAPDDGMAINYMTQIKLLEIGMPMVAELDGSSLPPGIISWRELLILESEVERRGIDFIKVLAEWRLEGSDGTRLATSLQHFMQMQPGFLGLFTAKYQKKAERLFDRVSQRGFSWTLQGLSDKDRRREINKYQAITGKTWKE